MARKKSPVNVEIPDDLELTQKEIAALKDTFKFQIAGILSIKHPSSVGPFAETNIKIKTGPPGTASGKKAGGKMARKVSKKS